MTEETQEEREARYENIYDDFKERRSSGEYAWFDFSVPAGWLDLVIELDQKLEELIPGYTIAQAKSKFGGLRYYINYPESEELSYGSEAGQKAAELIADAEDQSLEMCEHCGEPGKSVTPRGFWVWTLCEAHAAELSAI